MLISRTLLLSALRRIFTLPNILAMEAFAVIFVLILSCLQPRDEPFAANREQLFANELATVVSSYFYSNTRTHSLSWEDMRPYFKEISIRDNLLRRYAILADPVSLPPPLNGDLLVITRKPFRDSRLEINDWGLWVIRQRSSGRYLIYRDAQGDCRVTWQDEAYVQKVFNNDKSLLPAPDSEPMRPRESQGIWFAVMRPALAVLFLALVAAAFLLRARWRMPVAAC